MAHSQPFHPQKGLDSLSQRQPGPSLPMRMTADRVAIARIATRRQTVGPQAAMHACHPSTPMHAVPLRSTVVHCVTPRVPPWSGIRTVASHRSP